MQMEKDEAQSAIKALIRGEDVPRVFNECSYCFNCNRYCPEGLRPYELILQRTLERRQSVPAVLKNLFNGMATPNMFQDIYSYLSDQENAILDKWSVIPPPAKEILWVGCIGKISCLDIENSNVLRSLPKFGPRDLCCGEIAYRLGSWDMYTRTIERTLEQFRELNIERMVCYCGSCYNYFSSILPNVYGKKLPFKLISMYQWMLERIKNSELELKKPLNFRAAVHESCYITELEKAFPDALRDLYRAAGMEIVELEHHGENNLSCGIMSFVRGINPYTSLFREQKRKYREVKNAGVNQIALNCPGCLISMSFTHFLFGKKLRYMPDELLEAYGDTITKPLAKRIHLFIRAFLKHPTLPFRQVHPETSGNSNASTG